MAGWAVFLSYAEATNEAETRDLKVALEDAGIPSFRFEEDSPAGEPVGTVLTDALLGSRVWDPTACSTTGQPVRGDLTGCRRAAPLSARVAPRTHESLCNLPATTHARGSRGRGEVGRGG
jgi:hypothetical protein